MASAEPLLSFWETGNLLLYAQLSLSTSFPGRQHFTCCHNSLLEDLSTSHVTPLGKDTWKLKPGFFRTLPRMPFPFADYVWRPVSPPSESSNLAVVLGRHGISLYLASFQCAILIPALPGSSLKS